MDYCAKKKYAGRQNIDWIYSTVVIFKMWISHQQKILTRSHSLLVWYNLMLTQQKNERLSNGLCRIFRLATVQMVYAIFRNSIIFVLDKNEKDATNWISKPKIYFFCVDKKKGWILNQSVQLMHGVKKIIGLDMMVFGREFELNSYSIDSIKMI